MALFINIESFSEAVRKALDEAEAHSATITAWGTFLDSLENYANDNRDNPQKSRVINHGEWIEDGFTCGDNEYKCPFCNHVEWRSEETNFCPNCGADMRPLPPEATGNG